MADRPVEQHHRVGLDEEMPGCPGHLEWSVNRGHGCESYIGGSNSPDFICAVRAVMCGRSRNAGMADGGAKLLGFYAEYR